MTVYETYVPAPMAAITVLDRFAQQRGTRGPLPDPIAPLTFRFVARQETAGMTPLDPPVTLYAQSRSYGAFVFPDEARHGKSELYRILPGRYLLRIESDYYQPIETELDWPPPRRGMPVLFLQPGAAYPFPDTTLASAGVTLLRGTVVRGVTGEPVDRAHVEIIDPPNLGDFDSCETDARGGWVLALLRPEAPPDEVTVRFTFPDDTTFDAVVEIVAGADNNVSQTSLRGSVLTQRGLPIAAATITVDGIAGSVLSRRDGNWNFYLALDQADVAKQVTALAPDGQSATQNVQILKRKTVVVPTFRIG